MRREAAAANTVTRVQRVAYSITAAIAIVFAGVYSIGAHVRAYLLGIDLHLSMPTVSIAAPSVAVLSLMIATALIGSGLSCGGEGLREQLSGFSYRLSAASANEHVEYEREEEREDDADKATACAELDCHG